MDRDIIEKYKSEMLSMYKKTKKENIRVAPVIAQTTEPQTSGKLLAVVTTVITLYPVPNAKVTVFTGDYKDMNVLSYGLVVPEKKLSVEIKEHLNKIKPVIVCGDLNVAHKEIDLKNPSTNRRSAGFTDEERNKMSELLDAGFVDTFRYLYPNKENAYTWWSYMRQARDKDIGWRIDYFLVSKDIKEKIEEASIHKNVMGSDHCPVELDINI